jgi:hypothetical protein
MSREPATARARAMFDQDKASMIAMADRNWPNVSKMDVAK